MNLRIFFWIWVLLFFACDNAKDKEEKTIDKMKTVDNTKKYYKDYDFFSFQPLDAFADTLNTETKNYYIIDSNKLYNNYGLNLYYRLDSSDKNKTYISEIKKFDYITQTMIILYKNSVFKSILIKEKNKKGETKTSLYCVFKYSTDLNTEKFVFSPGDCIIKEKNDLMKIFDDFTTTDFKLNPLFNEYYKYKISFKENLVEYEGTAWYKQEDNKTIMENYKQSYETDYNNAKLSFLIFFDEAFYSEIEK